MVNSDFTTEAIQTSTALVVQADVVRQFQVATVVSHWRMIGAALAMAAGIALLIVAATPVQAWLSLVFVLTPLAACALLAVEATRRARERV